MNRYRRHIDRYMLVPSLGVTPISAREGTKHYIRACQPIAPEDRPVLEGDLAIYNFAWASVANAARYHV